MVSDLEVREADLAALDLIKEKPSSETDLMRINIPKVIKRSLEMSRNQLKINQQEVSKALINLEKRDTKNNNLFLSQNLKDQELLEVR